MTIDIRELLKEVTKALENVENIGGVYFCKVEQLCDQTSSILRKIQGKLEATLEDEEHLDAEEQARSLLFERFNGDRQAITETLDELVHELASRPASGVNNGGLDEQIAYIFDQCGSFAMQTIREHITEN